MDIFSIIVWITIGVLAGRFIRIIMMNDTRVRVPFIIDRRHR